jgi:hypothetical protein
VLGELQSSPSSHYDASFQPTCESLSVPAFDYKAWCCLANQGHASYPSFVCVAGCDGARSLEVLWNG